MGMEYRPWSNAPLGLDRDGNVRDVEAVQTIAKGHHSVSVVAQPANTLLERRRQMMLVAHTREGAAVWIPQ